LHFIVAHQYAVVNYYLKGIYNIMKIAAIIAEYNPFHKGHEYHVTKTREITGATHVVAVMSGNFTQRGDIAILPKHTRAEAALKSGVDLVTELPVAFALSSAEQFATGAVAILNALFANHAENHAENHEGIVLSFGSECGDVELLKEAAGAVHYAQTTDEFFAAMRAGKSYPAALQSAVETFYTDDVTDVLTHPNNTLAVEYIKALNESGSSIQPFTVRRIGAGHDCLNSANSPDSELCGGILCASQIRKMMSAGEDVTGFVPTSDLRPPTSEFAALHRLEAAILAKLRMMSAKEIKRAPNVTGGLENRIYKAARAAKSLPELYFLAKTKRYTLARIRRAVLCCFLGITQSDVKLMPQYVRILGMNDRGRELLGVLGKGCPLPVDTSLAALAKKSDSANRQAMLEGRCTDVYGLAFAERRVCGRDFTTPHIYTGEAAQE
jgi:predicted nucleotidyltransferase